MIQYFRDEAVPTIIVQFITNLLTVLQVALVIDSTRKHLAILKMEINAINCKKDEPVDMAQR